MLKSGALAGLRAICRQHSAKTSRPLYPFRGSQGSYFIHSPARPARLALRAGHPRRPAVRGELRQYVWRERLLAAQFGALSLRPTSGYFGAPFGDKPRWQSRPKCLGWILWEKVPPAARVRALLGQPFRLPWLAVGRAASSRPSDRAHGRVGERPMAPLKENAATPSAYIRHAIPPLLGDFPDRHCCF